MAIEWVGTEPLIRFWTEEDGSTHLDVRAFIESGGHPFAPIMACARQVSKGDRLVLHAPFQPKPLLVQLEKIKLKVEARHEGEDHWTVHIQK